MFKSKKSKGFTLIEILVTIIIIGLLASVILIMISASKDNARKKAAYSEVRAVQAELLQCVINESKAILCGPTDPSYPQCRGQLLLNSQPQVGSSVCSVPNVLPDSTNSSKVIWPNIARYQYAYGQVACSSKSQGAFSYAIGKEGSVPGNIEPSVDKIFCCTQNGCSEIKILSTNIDCHHTLGIVSQLQLGYNKPYVYARTMLD